MKKYMHSGETGALFSFMFALLPLISSVPAIIYAYATIAIPIVGWITIILAFCYSAGVGYISSLLLKIFHVRNNGLAIIMAFYASTATIYLQWVAFAYAYEDLINHAHVGYIEVLIHPISLWSFMGALAADGWYSIKEFQVKGPLLWLLWLGEAFLFYMMSLLFTLHGHFHRSYCEECKKWMNERASSLIVNVSEKRSIVDQLVDTLPLEIRIAKRSDNRYFQVITQACKNHDHMAVASIIAIEKQFDSDETEKYYKEEVESNVITSNTKINELLKISPNTAF